MRVRGGEDVCGVGKMCVGWERCVWGVSCEGGDVKSEVGKKWWMGGGLILVPGSIRRYLHSFEPRGSKTNIPQRYQ